MKKFLIVAGGDYSPLKFSRDECFIIACDKGYEYVRNQGVLPDLVLGDFDSYKEPLPQNLPVIKLPVQKDDTDTMFAVKYAVENGATDIVLTCATGGRLDHTVANVQSCLYCLKKGVNACITDSTTEIYFIKDGSRRFEKKQGYSLSVFAVTEKCRGVTITGAEYTLDDSDIENSFPIGVSNAWKDDFAEISVKQGVIMVVLSELN